jgi:GT2 family glycosyltransferase
MKFGAVVIGRNEGERLRRCLASLSSAAALVYVDSGSTDGSAKRARDQGVQVLDLDTALPFTAARARNAGFRRLQEIAPEFAYVQFIDGDCELIGGWPEKAVSFLDAHPEIAVVAGQLRERHPEESIYNWLCDQEWHGPAGEVRATGGIVMIRTTAFVAVGGYREDVIAAEDDELCIRIREGGNRVWRLDCEMALHDAAMTHFRQWWRRASRAGYAYMQVGALHGKSSERYFAWESRRAWLFGLWLPLALLSAGLIWGGWAWALWLIYPMHALQKIVRNTGPLPNRAKLALFHVLGHFPETCGQIKFMIDRLLGKQARIIEYK